MNLMLIRNARKLTFALRFSVKAPSNVAHMSSSDKPKSPSSTDATVVSSHRDARDATSDMKENTDVLEVGEPEIQPEWLAMERRLAYRKPKLKGEKCSRI